MPGGIVQAESASHRVEEEPRKLNGRRETELQVTTGSKTGTQEWAEASSWSRSS